MEKLILASASSARKRLLRQAGIRFETRPARVKEVQLDTLRRSVVENASRKAQAAVRRHPDRWVLAADTMIEFKGRIHGKPSSRREAEDLLTLMAGRTHRLATGVVLQRNSRRTRRVAYTRVKLRALDRAGIRAILRGSAPTRMAGGYAIRRGRDPLIEKLDGSFTNVVGLPMEVVLPLLKKIGATS